MNERLSLLPEAASTFAPKVDLILYSLIGVTAFFVVLIAFFIVYFSRKFSRKNNPGVPPITKTYMPLEIGWTVIPLLIALAFFWWGAKLFLAEKSNGPKDAYEVYVLGKQWMWKFQHPGGRLEINELHVPVGKPVRLIMVSEDVIHDLFVPAFRTKQDVLPMRYTTLWFEPTKEGTYHLFCSQYCGTKHSAMVGEVVAMTPSRFEKWLEGVTGAHPIAQGGEALLDQLGCRTCHRPNSTQMAPFLEALYGSRVALSDGKSVLADENYIRESILDPKAKVVQGYQPVMPSYQGRVTEADLIQIVSYLKSVGAK